MRFHLSKFLLVSIGTLSTVAANAAPPILADTQFWQAYDSNHNVYFGHKVIGAMTSSDGTIIFLNCLTKQTIKVIANSITQTAACPEGPRCGILACPQQVQHVWFTAEPGPNDTARVHVVDVGKTESVQNSVSAGDSYLVPVQKFKNALQFNTQQNLFTNNNTLWTTLNVRQFNSAVGK